MPVTEEKDKEKGWRAHRRVRLSGWFQRGSPVERENGTGEGENESQGDRENLVDFCRKWAHPGISIEAKCSPRRSRFRKAYPRIRCLQTPPIQGSFRSLWLPLCRLPLTDEALDGQLYVRRSCRGDGSRCCRKALTMVCMSSHSLLGSVLFHDACPLLSGTYRLS